MADEHAVTSTSGFIASSVVQSLSLQCIGEAIQSWLISGSSSQRVNLTLYDFSSFPMSTYNRADSIDARTKENRKTTASRLVMEVCRRYGVIEDKEVIGFTTICGREERISELYLSVGNSLRVWIEAATTSNYIEFLICYKGGIISTFNSDCSVRMVWAWSI